MAGGIQKGCIFKGSRYLGQTGKLHGSKVEEISVEVYYSNY